MPESCNQCLNIFCQLSTVRKFQRKLLRRKKNNRMTDKDGEAFKKIGLVIEKPSFLLRPLRLSRFFFTSALNSL